MDTVTLRMQLKLHSNGEFSADELGEGCEEPCDPYDIGEGAKEIKAVRRRKEDPMHVMHPNLDPHRHLNPAFAEATRRGLLKAMGRNPKRQPILGTQPHVPSPPGALRTDHTPMACAGYLFYSCGDEWCPLSEHPCAQAGDTEGCCHYDHDSNKCVIASTSVGAPLIECALDEDGITDCDDYLGSDYMANNEIEDMPEPSPSTSVSPVPLSPTASTSFSPSTTPSASEIIYVPPLAPTRFQSQAKPPPPDCDDSVANPDGGIAVNVEAAPPLPAIKGADRIEEIPSRANQAVVTSTLNYLSSLTLEQIMADPKWMGAPPQWPYWAEDSRTIYFDQAQPDTDRNALWSIGRASGEPQRVSDALRSKAPTYRGVWDIKSRRKLYIFDGDVYLADTQGQRQPLMRTSRGERDPMWTTDPEVIAYRRGQDWLAHDLRTGRERQLIILRTSDDPAEEDEMSFLEQQQQRLFSTLAEQKAQEDDDRDHWDGVRQADPWMMPPPVYLGDDIDIKQSSLSPDLRHMLVVTSPSGSEPQQDEMPIYVTRSGYVETETLRRKVGEGGDQTEGLLLIDLAAGSVQPVPLAGLPGASDDPLAALRDEPQTAARSLSVLDIQWHPSGGLAAVQLRADDNKDRWIITVAPGEDTPSTQLVHRLTDPAWVPWSFNELGWLPDRRRAALWFLSEETGYSHLYLHEDQDITPLTSGDHEVSSVQVSPDGRWLYYTANADHPGVYEVWRAPVAGGVNEPVTALGGRNRYTLSPDGDWLLIRHGETGRPPEIFVQRARPGAAATRRTDTLSDAFRAIDWVEPELVTVPSAHGAGVIYGRLYAPAEPSAEPAAEPRPAVLFIHGAGYMQNAHAGWSYYFREFMFHTLLVQNGYVVLDLDYRASAGYGRDWRTAIYRQMGTPEVEDLMDGADWLAENHGVDRDRVGLYGGSYGGFLTLMGLFTQPGSFAAGAALRPVTDWAHYNHGYTANILNTPALDPEAYLRSSPIEHAAGLADPLLICHGLMDENVVAQDAIRLTQRLIELEKQDWELALYPLERHGFVEPSAWLDEYRRIFKLFETHLN
jgi:dipeptidyl aminopeptidase/acylaminoacyl peptidase